ncbi:MAG TPA: RCC1 domain-containing protein [Polyangia bacterium]
MRAPPPPSSLLLSLLVLANCGGPRRAGAIDAGVPDGNGSSTEPDVRDVSAAEPETLLPGSDAEPDNNQETQAPLDAPLDEAAEVAEIPRRYRAVALAAGGVHNCALMEDRRIFCWGNNGFAQLGQGDIKDRAGAHAVNLGAGVKAKAIAAARYATCAIVEDGGVLCWGYRAQLGRRGGLAGGSGAPTDPDARLDLGPGRTARLIGMGYREACAVLDDESVACWGDAYPTARITSGPLATKVASLTAFGTGVAGLSVDGKLVHLGSKRGFVQPDDGDRFVTVGGSQFKLCVASAKGRLACGEPQAMAYESTLPYQTLPTALSVADFGPVCALEGTVVWCHNVSGMQRWWAVPGVSPLGTTVAVNLDAPAASLSNGGGNQACALLQDGAVKCWGDLSIASLYGTNTPTPGQPWPPIDFGPRP